MDIETLKEARRKAIRAMVNEIGQEPNQDMHFDLWCYPGQHMQPYEHSVIREFVKLKGAEASSALVAMADYLLLNPA